MPVELIIIGLIAAGVAAFIVVKKRKAKKQEQVPPPAPVRSEYVWQAGGVAPYKAPDLAAAVTAAPPRLSGLDVSAPTPAWPTGAHEFTPGAWYVPYRGANGGPFKTPAEAYEWMARIDQNIANQEGNTTWQSPGRGSIPVGEVGDYDLGYLAGMVGAYNQAKHNGDIFRDVLQGTHAEIAEAINRGDRANPGRNQISPGSGRVKAAVDAAFAAAVGKEQDPFGAGFASRVQFDEWARTFQNPLYLDGRLVKLGVGVDVRFATRPDGRIVAE